MYQELIGNFEKNKNGQNATSMSKYMRNQFEFYGIQSKQRKLLQSNLLKRAKQKMQIDWEEIYKIWNDPHREMQYFVCDYLISMKKFITYEDLPRIEKFIRSKQWWDTIDVLTKLYGQLSLRDPRVSKKMLAYSVEPDFWVRRLSIEHQLLLKDDTDEELLNQILVNNLNSQDFFINKAIGWALRDYSKTNPQWVRNFIKEHQSQLATLSIREGSKYL